MLRAFTSCDRIMFLAMHLSDWRKYMKNDRNNSGVIKTWAQSKIACIRCHIKRIILQQVCFSDQQTHSLHLLEMLSPVVPLVLLIDCCLHTWNQCYVLLWCGVRYSREFESKVQHTQNILFLVCWCRHHK